jgi:hypothetical protein
MKGKSMRKDKEDIRAEYRREDLGKGARGKYFARHKKGRNLVLLKDAVAEAFPTAQAVNDALLGLLALTEKTRRIASRATRTPRKRAGG